MIQEPIRRPIVVRRAIALVVAVATLLAAPLSAQEPTPRPATHVVKKGDTLWDIAKMYLNDPFLWPEIYRLNTNVVEDPHWIYPGETLALPGAGGAEQQVAADTTGPGGAQVLAEDQMEKPPVVEQGPRQPAGTTVFAMSNQRRLASASKFGGTANTYSHTSVRPQEFYAAPWLDQLSGPANAGQIVRTAQLPGEVRGAQRALFTVDEYLFVTMPKGVVPAKGDRFISFQMGEEIANSERVMVPTGILQVISVDATEAVLVRIERMFGAVYRYQGILPLERFAMNPDARPAPLLLGTEGHVIYIPTTATVANKQYYLILDVGIKDGVKVGDLFTVYKPRTKLELENASPVMLPEEAIGMVQVVKVNDYGATAIVTDVRYPQIIPGANVRLTARMP